jgi:hypothetical protein
MFFILMTIRRSVSATLLMRFCKVMTAIPARMDSDLTRIKLNFYVKQFTKYLFKIYALLVVLVLREICKHMECVRINSFEIRSHWNFSATTLMRSYKLKYASSYILWKKYASSYILSKLSKTAYADLVEAPWSTKGFHVQLNFYVLLLKLAAMVLCPTETIRTVYASNQTW